MHTKLDKILVVDDSSMNIQILKRHLGKYYNIFSASNGQEALKIIEQQNPCIVLLDVIMPIMDGYQTCQYIKNHPEMQNIPVVMITSLSEKKDRIQAIESGADDFLSKPIDSYELLARVKSLIRIKKYNDQIFTQNRIYEKELEIAKKVQKAILPSVESIQIKNIEFYSTYIPWLDIGGDYFNILELKNNRIAVFLADVMGHGVSASLITMVLKTLFETYVHHQNNPSDFLYILNNGLCKIFGNILIYATAIYLIIDLDKKQFLYTNAGHPPTLLFHENKPQIITHLKSAGKPLGIYENSLYETIVHNFKDQEKLLLYTDGLTDVENGKRKEFGIQNVENFIDQHRMFKPKILIEKLIQKLYSFAGEQGNFPDDLSAICLKF